MENFAVLNDRLCKFPQVKFSYLGYFSFRQTTLIFRPIPVFSFHIILFPKLEILTLIYSHLYKHSSVRSIALRIKRPGFQSQLYHLRDVYWEKWIGYVTKFSSNVKAFVILSYYLWQVGASRRKIQSTYSERWFRFSPI